MGEKKGKAQLAGINNLFDASNISIKMLEVKWFNAGTLLLVQYFLARKPFQKKKVASAKSLASNRKRRHFCRPVHFGSPTFAII
jgi:hypothetical protein